MRNDDPGPEADDYDLAEPRPAALIESLRAFGYSPEAAIADLIDNSITAGATNIELDFHWAGSDSFIRIVDDGDGMDAPTLIDAMRPGSMGPQMPRTATDLGRFGLGLKTASFSQCRRLTVATKRIGSVRALRRWDLDYVNRVGEWRLLREAASGSASRLELGGDKGTVVLWECLDRLVEDVAPEFEPAKRRFLAKAKEIETHIAMVFHRFLESNRPLKIWIQGRRIEPWDPFMSGESATQPLGLERLPFKGDHVEVSPFVLPHYSKIDSDTHRSGAGPRGWNAQQGFYVYRNRRLLVAGDWLGLGFRKEEHHKLARIRIDIPNSMDEDWRIDVKKSRARPPGELVDDLQRIARTTRDRAEAIYRHRGRVIARKSSESYIFVWQQLTKHGRTSYRINRQHPLVENVMSRVNNEIGSIKAMLRLIEETVPIQLITMDSAERPDGQALPFESAPPAEVESVLREVFRASIASGISETQAKHRLVTMEPFQNYPELIAALGSGSRDED